MSELIKEIERQVGYDMIEEGNMTARDVLEIIKNFKEPQLNDNQKNLLKDLKHVYSWQHSYAWDLFYYLVDKDTSMFEEDTISLFYNMPEKDSLQVQILFSQWVLQQEENHE